MAWCSVKHSDTFTFTLPLIKCMLVKKGVRVSTGISWVKTASVSAAFYKSSDGLFPSGFQTKIFHAFLISRISSTCIAHFILVFTLTIFDEVDRLRSSLLWCSLLQSPVTSSFLGPNILLYILFSYSLNTCSSLTE